MRLCTLLLIFQVCITPLDNLVLLGKPSTLSTTRLPICTVSQLSEFSPCNYEMQYTNVEGNDTNYSTSIPTQEEDKSEYSENQLTNHVTHVGLEDMSMSFLSLSLKYVDFILLLYNVISL